MIHVLIVAREGETRSELRKGLGQYDLACSFTSSSNGVRDAVTSRQPDILLFEMDAPPGETGELIKNVKIKKNVPVIALIPEEMLESLDHHPEFDDFIASPYDARELILRINRLVRRTDDTESREQIKRGGLVIDLATCEVAVEGKIVELTFKEYELLKLLAGHPGRVYTREALLNKIWGYDYFGGDRTVDVHVRRLRSKIEDADHTFIETVRNIGYRFIKEA
jgi:two-component system alkaline phosphatase synthesis response regulator PhoP